MSAHERPSPRHLPCYLAIDANAVTQARGASIQAREADDEPSAHPHLVIATAVHVRLPPIRKSRHARPTLSNIWDLPRVGPSATRTMALPHCPARCRHCQGAACLTWCSKLAAPPAKSTVAGSERPTVLKAAACSHHAARRVGSAPMIDAAAKLASAIVAAARRPLAWSRRPMSSAREPCCHWQRRY